MPSPVGEPAGRVAAPAAASRPDTRSGRPVTALACRPAAESSAPVRISLPRWPPIRGQTVPSRIVPANVLQLKLGAGFKLADANRSAPVARLKHCRKADHWALPGPLPREFPLAQERASLPAVAPWPVCPLPIAPRPGRATAAARLPPGPLAPLKQMAIELRSNQQRPVAGGCV